MLPLRDNIPTRRFPVVTVGLIVANALVWLLYQVPDLRARVFDLAGLERQLAHLLASSEAEVRARRRFEELVAKGSEPPPSFEATLADVLERDERDRTRAIAPLRQAADAVLVDTSDMTMEEVVAKMVAIVRKH